MGFNFTITQVFPGTQKQKDSGIQAVFNMSLVVDGQTVISLQDLKLVKAKNGEDYIGSPYREYQGKNSQTGDAETKRIHFVRLWPDKANWSKQNDIVKAVLAKLNENQGTNASSTPTATTKTTAAKPPQVSTEAW